VSKDGSADKARIQLSERLRALASAAHPQLRAECRRIADGDEFALTPAELRPIERAVAQVRRASGAARIVARTLLTELGAPPGVELIRSASRAPKWPPGFVGSLAHDREFAVAAVAAAAARIGVGIDVEPSEPLPDYMLDAIATPRERDELNGDLVSARLLFCVKEAVYKATNPIDGVFLEHHDVEVSLKARVALTNTGRSLQIHLIAQPRLVAVALCVA
jgi:4'-phosphopantetheinyl transferase EntD